MSRSRPTGLERVRELREHAEDRAREAFAASLNDRLRGLAQLQAADAALAAARAPVAVGRPVGALDLLARERWAERLERSKADAAGTVAALDAQVETRRGELELAGREREMLDRACERRAAEAAREAARREAAELDDLAQRRRIAA